MNPFQLVVKQMRQRALSTWLTLLSVLLGVALAISVLLIMRDSQNLFGQTDFGYELILGPPKGSDEQLVFSTVYMVGKAAGTVPYSLYEEMNDHSNRTYGPLVRQVIPFMIGDSYKGRWLVGTSPQMFGYEDDGRKVSEANPERHPWEYRYEKSFEFAQGRVFNPRRFEAVVGSEAARQLGLCIAADKDKPENKDKVWNFRATHGMPAPNETPDIHKPVWQIVGILAPTHTANDNLLFLPIVSLYAIEEHGSAMIQQAMIRQGIDPSHVLPDQLPGVLKQLGYDPQEIPPLAMRKLREIGLKVPSSQPATAPPPPKIAPGGDLMSDIVPKAPAPSPETAPAAGGADEDPDAFQLDRQGNIVPFVPKDEWELSAILVKTRGGFQAQSLIYRFRVANLGASAVAPAATMQQFFNTFLKPASLVLLVLAGLVSVVAAVSILVSIYNSVSARQREIAILRALGATRGRILGLICLEAGLIGLLGGVLGLLAGHSVAAVGSIFFQQRIGEGIRWAVVSPQELYYLGAVIVVALLAGLVPALKAYGTPVATNLVAS